MAKGHPLDALTAEEIEAAASVVKTEAAARGLQATRFNTITLQEPTKAALVALEKGGDTPPRRAFCIVQDPPTASVYEAVVDLGEQPSLLSWGQVTQGQPVATPDDCNDAEAIAKADPEVQRLLLERYGLSDLTLLAGDPWSVHCPPTSGRLIQLFMYKRSSLDDNHYAHPLDMVVVVDLNLGKVVHIDMQKAAPTIPAKDSNYHQNLQDQPWRDDIKPLNVVQPEGPSFTVEGNLVKWQKWQFRVGFNYREGLVLHQLGYEDGGRVRPVMFRGSLVEMAVPYGDTNAPFQRKCAFDVGDYGLGYCAVPLALGCDCLGHIHYFDALLCNSAGAPVALKHAVCLHEEDAGLLWKHVDYRSGHSESRRSRRLSVSFVATVVNYEYCFYWYLYQDGTIQFEIKLTGELSTNLLSAGQSAPGEFGTLVLPGVNAQHHQHQFCARIDMAVDDEDGGKGLVVSEVNAVPMGECPENPYGNGFRAVEQDLTTTSAAQRVADPLSGRIWKVKNPAVKNPITGSPVAYKLMPGAAPLLLATPSSVIAKRGVFATKNLWVTPFAEEQRFPAGEYVLSSTECNGLAVWTKEDQELVGRDPVIWYAFGVTHVVRIEDFPVMPVETVGFQLKPFGFFTGNPGIDIPHGVNAASTKHCCANGTANGSANGSANGH